MQMCLCAKTKLFNTKKSGNGVELSMYVSDSRKENFALSEQELAIRAGYA